MVDGFPEYVRTSKKRNGNDGSGRVPEGAFGRRFAAVCRGDPKTAEFLNNFKALNVVGTVDFSCMKGPFW